MIEASDDHDPAGTDLLQEPPPVWGVEDGTSPAVAVAASEMDEDLLLEAAVSTAPTLLGEPVPGPPPQPRQPVGVPPPDEFDLTPLTEGPGGGGWLARTKDAARGALRRAERAVRTGVYSQAEEMFRARFPLLATERVIAMYGCRARHAPVGPSVEGALTLTDRSLCFAGPGGLGLVLPLRDIVSIQPAVFLGTAPGHPPYFLPTPSADVLPDSLQVYTAQHLRHNFHHFTALVPLIDATQTPLQRAVTYVDHAWRAATPVPAPGVRYADSPSLPSGCESEAVPRGP